jgi:hypothetical protein
MTRRRVARAVIAVPTPRTVLVPCGREKIAALEGQRDGI